MVLSRHRVRQLGETPYPWEQEALDFIKEALPDRDPYHVWFLGGLPDPALGRHHDLDAVILGYHQVYLVEIKSMPGRYRGDSVEWIIEAEGEPTRYRRCPFGLTDMKARKLRSRIESHFNQARIRHPVPYVQALVFLSAEGVSLDLTPDGRMGVVTRQTFARAITHGEIPGTDGRHLRNRITAPMIPEVITALGKSGLRERLSRSAVGAYELRELLEEGNGYREYHAVHRSMPTMQRRARIYPAPEQSDAESRRRLTRAAKRDAANMHAVAGGPNLLHLSEFIDDAEPGPALLFEDFPESQRLDAFLRAHPDLPFEERAQLVLDVGHALRHCHDNRVVHGSLSPQSVLVRQKDDRLEVRLHGFQLGAGGSVQGTLHRTTLLGELGSAYQAPELFGNPGAVSIASDLFGLGALAYFVFTGHAPAEDGVSLRAKLREQGCLDPSEVSDKIDRAIVNHIIEATNADPEERANTWDVGTWIALLEDLVTAPSDDDAELDPLEAGPEAILGTGPHKLRVVRTIGRGATSKVKEVERLSDGQRLALKISAAPEHDERLRAEGEALSRLRHDHIVQYEATLELGGRVCLLMRLAGEITLRKHLDTEGALSLADAKVLGSDLLSALESLELSGVLHRDIKPANIGFGSLYSGRRHQLTLFDFSAAGLPITSTSVGTAGYRDPFLEARGSADAAADRYSAAVVLHELLTGERPDYGGTEHSPSPKLRLAAARFDPAVRDPLIKFFEQALHPNPSERFDSADEMRRAWGAALETSEHGRSQKKSQLAFPHVLTIENDTPIAALDELSPRAKNALDRAGLVVAEDLLRLPKNRIHAMRSVGATVAEEILAFRDKWLAALPDPASEPFFPNYRGKDLGVMTALPSVMGVALRYAGLHSFAAVAAAHRGQLEKLAERYPGFDLKALADALGHEHLAAGEDASAPTSLAGWIAAFLPEDDKKYRHPRALFGLDGPLAGRTGTSQRQLAQALGIQRQAVQQALSARRAEWAQHPSADALVALVEQAAAALGHAATLDEIALRVYADIAGEVEAAPTELVQAAALVRVALEILHERDAGEDAPVLHLAQVHGTPFVCITGLEVALRRLGDAADELADRSVLAGPEAALARLREVLAAQGDSRLDSLSGPRLLTLAAAASKHAARSAQLEIYPRGMPPAQALSHTSPVLGPEPTRAEVIERVRRRYPEAAPLPEGEALDLAMAELGYRFVPDERGGRYVRSSHGATSIVSTTRSTSLVHVTAHPGQPLRMDDAALAARAFDERLHVAREQRRFCVLGVHYGKAMRARERLLNEHGLREVSLDALLLEEVRALCEEDEIDLADVWKVDAAGPDSPEWPDLVDLMKDAARRVVRRLLPAEAPTLLTNPGLIERFGLTELLAALSGVSDIRSESDSAALVLLVPTYDALGAPRINDRMPVPNVMGLTEIIPRAWLEKADRAAAS